MRKASVLLKIGYQSYPLYIRIKIPTVDITIAAIAKLNKLPLFTKDDHFEVIANHFGLKLYN